ncbi:transposase [Lacticaseibacillus paracasei]|nr:transposase [Lacticaseibacillus paracasei]
MKLHVTAAGGAIRQPPLRTATGGFAWLAGVLGSSIDRGLVTLSFDISRCYIGRLSRLPVACH